MGNGAGGWVKRRADTVTGTLLDKLDLSPIEQDLLEIIDSLEKRLITIEEQRQDTEPKS